MKLYCKDYDHARFGPDRWQPIGMPGVNAAPSWTPGLVGVMSTYEPNPEHWNLRPGAPKSLRDAAVAKFAAFVAKHRAACPPGTPVWQWAVTAFWNSSWPKLTEAQKQAIVDHWCGVLKDIRVDAVCVSDYDVVPDADPSNGNEHAVYEADVSAGRLGLGRRVADALGMPFYVTLWNRQKWPTPGGIAIGRSLWRHEILTQVARVVEHRADGIVAWNGDESFVGNVCNPAAAAQLPPAVLAAMREQWAPEVFGEQPAVWGLETLPQVRHVTRILRMRWADTIVAAISN